MKLHANEEHLSNILLPLAEVSLRVWNAKYRVPGAGGDQSIEDTWGIRDTAAVATRMLANSLQPGLRFLNSFSQKGGHDV
jgi:hypothetical protein